MKGKKTGIQLQKQVYNIINKDKIKENKREYNMKKSNEKYGYTEDKIKEINEQIMGKLTGGCKRVLYEE